MNVTNILVCSALVSFILSCSNVKKEAAEEKKTKASNITLTKAPNSPSFPRASLTKMNSSAVANNDDSLYTVNYTFEVKGYELGVQTEDATTRGIANSDKGQHIHYIVNNGPYAAHYMSNIDGQLEAGNYVVLAFLSRSYHESLKNSSAFHVENLNVGDVEPSPINLSAPHLFYSRPKGTYKGEEVKKVMLDFYLLNTLLSADGNKVKAIINDMEFIIDEWTPYFIEGLPMGENAIKLALIDMNGDVIDGPFNQVERVITLEK